MKIFFKDRDIESICTVYREANRRFGMPSAKKILAHLDRLRAVSCLEDMRHLPGHLHELDDDRSFQLALSLHGGHRLVFEGVGVDLYKTDGSLDWRKVTEVCIVYVGDYHD